MAILAGPLKIHLPDQSIALLKVMRQADHQSYRQNLELLSHPPLLFGSRYLTLAQLLCNHNPYRLYKEI